MGAGQLDRFLLYYSSLLPETGASGPGDKPRAFVAGGVKVEFSLKLLPSALSPCLPSKPVLSALLKCTQ